VALLPPAFELHREALGRAVTSRTRLVLVNTPHNPVGKVFTCAELERIAEVCRDRGLIAVTDEVYEHLAFDAQHVPLATLPGMRERTVMISSSGKTFGVTGWKIGFACAAPEISAAIRAAHQFVTFCSATPFQRAIAAGLAAPDAYYLELARTYRARRDMLCEGLEGAGFAVRPPAGTYFAVADIRPLGFEDGDAFCRELPARAGVAAIPVGSFCEDPLPVRHLVRFAFCKTEATIREAVSRLRRLGRIPSGSTGPGG
jgi:N-succinyldiaminopimelate aminotransferase